MNALWLPTLYNDGDDSRAGAKAERPDGHVRCKAVLRRGLTGKESPGG